MDCAKYRMQIDRRLDVALFFWYRGSADIPFQELEMATLTNGNVEDVRQWDTSIQLYLLRELVQLLASSIEVDCSIVNFGKILACHRYLWMIWRSPSF